MISHLLNRMDVYRYLLLLSTLLNAFAFLYCFTKMNIKTLYLGREKKKRGILTGPSERSRITIAARNATKAILNILLTMLLLISSLYVTVTSDIALAPYFTFNSTIGYSMCLLLAVCLFNLVLRLDTDSLCLRNIHEIPMFMVMALLCTTIIVKQENAMAGIICQIMSGSLFSDELYRVRCCINNTGKTTPPSNVAMKYHLIFRIAMHLLCNIVFPIVMFFVPSWFSKEEFFGMHLASIIIFFLSTVFLLLCNMWRFNCLLHDFIQFYQGAPAAPVGATKAPFTAGAPLPNVTLNVQNALLKEYFMNTSSAKNVLLEEYNKTLFTPETTSVLLDDDEYTNLTTQSDNIEHTVIYTRNGYILLKEVPNLDGN